MLLSAFERFVTGRACSSYLVAAFALLAPNALKANEVSLSHLLNWTDAKIIIRLKLCIHLLFFIFDLIDIQIDIKHWFQVQVITI